MSDQFNISPKPTSKSANKPIYIMIVEDPEKKAFTYYKVDNIDYYNGYVAVRGFELQKAQANRLRANVNAKNIAYTVPVDLVLPWQRIVRMENLTYSQTRMEKNKDGK